jgi:hypothetical protein
MPIFFQFKIGLGGPPEFSKSQYRVMLKSPGVFEIENVVCFFSFLVAILCLSSMWLTIYSMLVYYFIIAIFLLETHLSEF